MSILGLTGLNMPSYLHSFSHFIPASRITSTETEERIRKESPELRLSSGVIEQLTQITSRPQATESEQSSDLAVAAASRCLKKAGLSGSEIDLLIFASASQDIAEPATANIVQEKLGLVCPVFDVKNACNSFLNGLEIATSFVNDGQYTKVLVVTGEIPSRLSRHHFASKQAFKEAFATFTLGDAGGAAIVSYSDEPSNVLYKKFYSHGKYWRAASVFGGGSLYPFNLEKFMFYGDANEMKKGFEEIGDLPLKKALKECDIAMDDVKAIFLHQVASAMTNITIEKLHLPKEKVFRTVERHGNLASASLPTAISEAMESGYCQRGDLVVVMGLASGISGTVWILKL